VTAPTGSTGRFPARSAGRFPALDGVRALAAFGVLATHVGFNSGRSLDDGPLAPFLARLDFGVTLFFLLSGFVIFRPFVTAALGNTAAPATGRFLVRRLVRILPAYWLAVVVTLAVLTQRPPTPRSWLTYPLLLQTYTHGNVDPSLTQLWTLPVELSFYLLLPFAAAWIRRDPTADRSAVVRRTLLLIAGMCGIAVAANIAAHLVPAVGSRSLIWLPANLDWFALGMLLAMISACAGRIPADRLPRLFGTGRTVAGATGLCWALAGLVFWFTTLPVAGSRLLVVPSGWEWSIKHYLYGGCAVLLLAPLTLAEPGRAAELLRARPVRYLGEISYGVYLWHLPLLLAFQHWLGFRTFYGHFWTLLALTACGATAAATLSWRFLERPLMRRAGRRYPSSERAVSAGESAGEPVAAVPSTAESPTAISAASTSP